ncbi:MAG: hypothetical protein ACREXK_11220 [Gammaproteobacteria bacterium]
MRELQHVIERAGLSQESRLALGDWFHEACASPASPRLASLEELESAHILKVSRKRGVAC